MARSAAPKVIATRAADSSSQRRKPRARVVAGQHAGRRAASVNAAVGASQAVDSALVDVAWTPTDREAQLQLLGRRVRMLAAMIRHFRGMADRGSDPRALARALQQIVDSATECFLGAATLHPGEAALHPDHARAIRELQAFARRMHATPLPTRHELRHATDSVLVLCTLLDAERHASRLG